ncbi:MAG TPA: MerR family transcriptional regulator [Pirellulales bacterium]
MPYTVKQVAAISGVSVRTLHFYDEAGLLPPAYVGANGYRFYEEPQLLALQQILFYRELGFELKQIKGILGRADFEKLAALKSHREVLEQNLARTRCLIETIDKTIQHLEGTKTMSTSEMFEGFSVAAGDDRFGDDVKLGEYGDQIACKLSGKDTGGATCIFEFIGHGGGPRHLHLEQDEWIYVVEGEFEFEVGERRFRLGAGQCVFILRKVPHVWACASTEPGRVINVYQPAGQMEAFFRTVTSFPGLPTRDDVLNNSYTKDHYEAVHRLFSSHGMEVLGPPMVLK